MTATLTVPNSRGTPPKDLEVRPYLYEKTTRYEIFDFTPS